MKNLGRFIRRKSISERELRKDYPTNSDSDDITDEEYRRRYWQRGLNSKASDRLDNFSDNFDVGHWDYESEYNYSIHSESSANDGYKEHSPRLYSDMDVERAIEQAMKSEFVDKDEHKPPRRPSDDRKDNYRNSSSVNETVRKFEQSLAKRRNSAIHQTRPFEQPVQKNNRESYGKTFHSFSRKKQRKQSKQRRRARDINSELSDDDEETKYAVNITMDDLNNLIKKNINSAVKSIVSKTKSHRPISPCESMSTETETFFSGSSSQSAEISPGLLAKQIKAQLDTDKLRGIIKQAVANETSEVFKKPNNAINNVSNVQVGGTTVTAQHPDFQQSAHLNPYVTHAQMIPHSHSQVPPPPPPPPPPPVPMVSNLMPPQVTFTLPDGMPMRQQSPHFLDDMTLAPGALRRLNNRRHTLAALGSDTDISALGDGLDNKIEQFSNALKLIDKTIQKAEDSVCQSKSMDEENKNNTNVKPDVGVQLPGLNVTQNSENSNFGPVATIPGGGLAPILSIADHIKALSKQKKKREPKPGEIEMSSYARTFLILTNMTFLMVGGAVISLGVWLLMDPNIETYFQIINVDQSGTDFKIICYGLTAFGIFALVMVGVLTLIEASIGAMIILNRKSPTSVPILSSILSDMESYLKKQMKISLMYSYLPETLIGTTWDLVQKHLECCGATGVDDYLYSKWKNETNPETDFPDTCCVLMDKNAKIPEPSNKLLCHFNTAGFYFETGCFDKMVGWFKDNSTYIVIASSVILALEVFSFLSAFIICRKAVKAGKRKKEAKRYSLTGNKPGMSVGT
ncbi:hypothetical protein ACF0H5_015647 [Mactra antiquata]